MSVTWADPSVQMTVEIAFAAGSGFGIWNASTWDAATWGPDVTWTDVTGYVLHERGITIDRAFTRDTLQWEAGRAQLSLLNLDGRFSPTNLSGPYVAAGETQIRPWRPLRIWATYGGNTYHLYRGYVTEWIETWDTSGRRPIVTIRCVDELGSLARFDGLEQSPVGGGETSGRRLHRILDNAGHAGERAIALGQHTMQPTTLAQNAVTEMKVTVSSEGGWLWVEADGTITMEDRDAPFVSTRMQTVQATFADDGSGAPYADVQVVHDGQGLANVVAFARAGGSAVTVADDDSRALYGDKRYARFDLVCMDDIQVTTLATRWLTGHATLRPRIEQVTVTPRSAPGDLWQHVLGRRMLDRVQVRRTPVAGDVITADVLIIGVHHRCDARWWTTTWDVIDATPFSGLGTWDASMWDDTKWGA